MTTELWIAIFGFLGTCVVTGRMAMTYWFKQQEKIEKLKDENNSKSIQSLDMVVDGQRKDLNFFGNKVDELEKQLKTHGVKLTDNTETTKDVVAKLVSYMRQTEQRFAVIESTIQRISENLILVKGKHGGTTDK